MTRCRAWGVRWVKGKAAAGVPGLAKTILNYRRIRSLDGAGEMLY
jgi:hypothetical protein